MADMCPKIRKIREEAERIGRKDLLIQVDGGIDVSTAPEVASAGAQVLVAGSAVFNKKDRKEAIAAIRDAADSASLQIS